MCFLQHSQRVKQPFRLLSVYSLLDHGERRRREEHFAGAGGGPGEAAALQAFGQQAQAVTGGPQQLKLSPVAATEDEDMAGQRGGVSPILGVRLPIYLLITI